MSDPLTPTQAEELLSELVRLVSDRAPAEVEIPTAFQRQKETLDREYRASVEAAAQAYEESKDRAEAEYAAERGRIEDEFQKEYGTAAAAYDEAKRGAIAACDAALKAGQRQLDEAQWEATTVFDAKKDEPGLRLKEIVEELDEGEQSLGELRSRAETLLRHRRQWRGPTPPPAGSRPEGDALGRFRELAEEAESRLAELAEQKLPRLFTTFGLVAPALAAALLGALVAGLVAGFHSWFWWAVGMPIGLAAWALVLPWVHRAARRQSSAAHGALARTIADAQAARQQALIAAEAECERASRLIAEQFQRDMDAASDTFLRISGEAEAGKQKEIERLENTYPARLEEYQTRHDRQLKETEEKQGELLKKLERDHYARSHKLGRDHALASAENDRRYRADWDAMAQRWLTGVGRVAATVEEMNAACRRFFPDWNATDWRAWQVPAEVPPAVALGRYEIGLGQLEGGVPGDQRLMPPALDFSLPAVAPFPHRSTLLVEAGEEGRAAAVEVIQALMLRMLTSHPPGKVRFTIIDPVGLGENFSAFMHLADYDEQLVASRIWTEANHIERRLADLTEHMETVIQVYLRNEYQTIQEYNAFAGELAEPYRVLVIANFPANFSEAAARRLTSIVSAGARCGIYTILSIDPKQRMPRDFHLSDLREQAFRLDWHEGRFVWEHAQMGRLVLTLDRPPEAEKFTQVVRAVGREVKDAGRVEVPFDCVVPEKDQWWTEDSRRGLDVPLGQAGATKLQFLRLGQGTSQHVLIAGKTGSGKSTLLHALVIAAALRYSPDELQFYLVDFKKGVEFKAYATYQFPHARVIAIESEREFGLSVLERLDLELKRRGDRFRRQGVQDLRGYRSALPEVKLPRILLIIDEFQELFVEEDAIAQNAALLLDRLVRQGRAFGIHVLLGSQTLAGAYSLARSTIGQMAVRIALQCSEADAHLILSEENTAARLLARPGEAIYNDANGLFEGNHPFQVVWLPEHQREDYLEQIKCLANQHDGTPRLPIVFEGNVPADPGANLMLRATLQRSAEATDAVVARAWLGAAVAIKDPTAVRFPRQSGSNLLLVGHREESALGVLAACVVSLAAWEARHRDESGASPGRFHVLDGTRPDAPEAGFWKRFAEAIPGGPEVASPRRAAEVIARIAAEVERREKADQEDAPAIYLVVYDLGRFRDLRRDEDDYGFGGLGDDKPPSPAKQFAKILRDGPALGVHCLLWCDSYNNVVRALDRQGLRDVELRVVFQMNATDSSNLIDTPAASRLGVHRAILYNESRGSAEKFRPYGLPQRAWLEWVRGQLSPRAAAAEGTSESEPPVEPKV